MGRLDKKVAIVTGAASPVGFGFETARRFAEEGARVVMTDSKVEELSARGAELRDSGLDVLDCGHDVTQRDQWDRVFKLTLEHFSSVDILVNNAGIVQPGGISEATIENWNAHIAVNLTSVFLGCQTAVRQMRDQNCGGSIINISSVAGIAAFNGLLSYVASKGGVRLLTKAAALDVAEYGIRINSVHPGHLDTDMLASARAVAPEMVKSMIANIPMQRLGTAADIAAMNLFLASDEARYITGAEFIVDGGLMAK